MDQENDQELYYRLNQDKLVLWLKSKVDNLLDKFESLEALKNFKMENKEERIKICLGILSDILSEDLIAMMCKEYSISSLKEASNILYFSDMIKRKEKDDKENVSKKPKVVKTVKANITGMKTITSFFTKK